MSLSQSEPKRVETVKRLVADARILGGVGSHDSAVILYVTALEILGEGLIQHFRVKKTVLQKFVRKHSLRQFVAATMLLAPVINRFGVSRFPGLNFKELSYKVLKKEDGVKVWHLYGDNPSGFMILHDLGSLFSRKHGGLFEESHADVCFWRNAAMGYYDNQRMSLIHMDNGFNFTYIRTDGGHFESGTLLSDVSSAEYSRAFTHILHSIEDDACLNLLGDHLEGLLHTFAEPLKMNFYVRK